MTAMSVRRLVVMMATDTTPRRSLALPTSASAPMVTLCRSDRHYVSLTTVRCACPQVVMPVTRSSLRPRLASQMNATATTENLCQTVQLAVLHRVRMSVLRAATAMRSLRKLALRRHVTLRRIRLVALLQVAVQGVRLVKLAVLSFATLDTE
jgi:hypothetical protein